MCLEQNGPVYLGSIGKVSFYTVSYSFAFIASSHYFRRGLATVLKLLVHNYVSGTYHTWQCLEEYRRNDFKLLRFLILSFSLSLLPRIVVVGKT